VNNQFIHFLSLFSEPCLAGIFNPIRRGNSMLIDAGLANPLPFDLIREACDVLVAIDVSGEKTHEDENNEPGFFRY